MKRYLRLWTIIDSREVGTDFHLSKVSSLLSLHRDENRRTDDHWFFMFGRATWFDILVAGMIKADRHNLHSLVSCRRFISLAKLILKPYSSLVNEDWYDSHGDKMSSLLWWYRQYSCDNLHPCSVVFMMKKIKCTNECCNDTRDTFCLSHLQH